MSILSFNGQSEKDEPEKKRERTERLKERQQRVVTSESAEESILGKQVSLTTLMLLRIPVR